MLSKTFLGGKYQDLPLNQIAEYAISETDLVTVQEYIRKLFEVFKPTPAHQLMCTFTWRGLATTNYDRLIEQAYETTPAAVQVPKPFIENGDRVEEHLRDPRSVMLLKLHGCITRTANPECPLILTTDQYIEYLKGRSRIFSHLREWAYELPLVFIGHSLQDPDLRAILLEMTQLGERRPRYYAVVPRVDDVQRRFWEAKRISPLQGTFEEFLQALDSTIPAEFRGLAVLVRDTALPIFERFKTRDFVLSKPCEQFLQTDVEYVKSVTSTETVTPSDFYKGVNLGWSAIEQQLDVRRHLADTLLSDHFLINEAEHRQGLELILIKAHAGAGKSVLLRRIAWDATHDYDCLCLYLRPYGVINAQALQELISLCKERIYLFVDNAADRAREIQSLSKTIGPEGKHLTVILAERTNEWNVSCAALAPLISTVHELRYLSVKEIDSLLSLLERHNALGTLTHLDLNSRRLALSERAGRQLLVALHEATLGKPFEDIIEDEYRSILPLEAQQIYLTICTLNRLNVRVRAGIVSRIHDVPFDEFRARLFGPLEHVVQVDKDPIIRDYTYRARHPLIAQIVFNRMLRLQEERYDAYIKSLGALNIDYSADRSAYRQMVRGRLLIELFPNHELAKGVLEVAKRIAGDDPYLSHQKALYEMHRPNGNLQAASESLSKALQSAYPDLAVAVKHSMAELRLRLADTARTPLEREKLLSEATSIVQSLTPLGSGEGYVHHTLVKIGLMRLKDLIEQPGEAISETAAEALVKDTERNLSEGLQLFPTHPYLLDAEAQLAKILDDAGRVLQALEKAFDGNPRSTFIALRLANYYKQHNDFQRSEQILTKALEANPGERRLHYAYARLLIAKGGAAHEVLVYHLRRSFTDGDNNYDAQLLYGRQLFLNGEVDESKEVFRRLGNARINPDVRDKLLYPMDQSFTGQVARLEATYCFIARDGLNDWIYAHCNNIDESAWKMLTRGTRVSFKIGFTMRGPNAFDVSLLVL
ncbi:MAG: SIR2 family protein [Nitrospirota bacterium]